MTIFCVVACDPIVIFAGRDFQLRQHFGLGDGRFALPLLDKIDNGLAHRFLDPVLAQTSPRFFLAGCAPPSIHPKLRSFWRLLL